MKKKCYRMRIVVMAAFLMFHYNVFAQESIELLQSEGSEESIIRELSPTSWLVYSNPDFHDFSIVSDDSSTVRIVRLPENLVKTVSDFKIHKNIVYLCGMLESKRPYWGYFDYLKEQPIFTYIQTSEVKQLKHLVVYGSVSEKLHVVMTAAGHDGRGKIVEAMGVPNNWYMYYVTPFVNQEELYAFDDIAISENYIAFTSYHTINSIIIDTLPFRSNPPSRLWYINKPSSLNNPAAYSLFNYRVLSYSTTGRFLVRNCEDDVFVTAAASTLTSPGMAFLVSGYDDTSHIATVSVFADFRQPQLQDLCYNPISKSTELVISTKLPAQSNFYTLIPGMAYASGVACGHLFTDCLAKSITRQSSTSMHFISTAYNTLNTSALNIIRYHSTYPEECSNFISTATKLIENDGVFIRGEKIVYYDAVIPGKKPCIIKTTGTVPYCGNKNQ